MMIQKNTGLIMGCQNIIPRRSAWPGPKNQETRQSPNHKNNVTKDTEKTEKQEDRVTQINKNYTRKVKYIY